MKFKTSIQTVLTWFILIILFFSRFIVAFFRMYSFVPKHSLLIMQPSDIFRSLAFKSSSLINSLYTQRVIISLIQVSHCLEEIWLLWICQPNAHKIHTSRFLEMHIASVMGSKTLLNSCKCWISYFAEICIHQFF